MVGRRVVVCETPLTGKTGAATCMNRYERVVLSMVELGKYESSFFSQNIMQYKIN